MRQQRVAHGTSNNALQQLTCFTERREGGRRGGGSSQTHDCTCTTHSNQPPVADTFFSHECQKSVKGNAAGRSTRLSTNSRLRFCISCSSSWESMDSCSSCRKCAPCHKRKHTHHKHTRNTHAHATRTGTHNDSSVWARKCACVWVWVWVWVGVCVCVCVCVCVWFVCVCRCSPTTDLAAVLPHCDPGPNHVQRHFLAQILCVGCASESREQKRRRDNTACTPGK